MTNASLPELWEWAEYYCPWCYIAAVRLQRILPEYEGRVRLVDRAFPLEVYGGGPPDRKELEAEMWLAAIQEPDAEFKPFGATWPTTTLPAFEAAWCACRQGDEIGRALDLRIRRAFFAEGRDIGDPGVMEDLAREVGLEMAQFGRDFASGAARNAILEEGRLGKESYGVRGTPTIMLGDGTRLRHKIAYPKIDDGVVLAVGRTPCCGTGCDPDIRDLFEKALRQTTASQA